MVTYLVSRRNKQTQAASDQGTQYGNRDADGLFACREEDDTKFKLLHCSCLKMTRSIISQCEAHLASNQEAPMSTCRIAAVSVPELRLQPARISRMQHFSVRPDR